MLCQNKKGQTFVEMHCFLILFFSRQLIQIHKQGFIKQCISTNIWPVLFLQGFILNNPLYWNVWYIFYSFYSHKYNASKTQPLATWLPCSSIRKKKTVKVKSAIFGLLSYYIIIYFSKNATYDIVAILDNQNSCQTISFIEKICNEILFL